MSLLNYNHGFLSSGGVPIPSSVAVELDWKSCLEAPEELKSLLSQHGYSLSLAGKVACLPPVIENLPFLMSPVTGTIGSPVRKGDSS